MEVALRECPACQAVVMGSETVCSDCGAALPPLPVPEPVVVEPATPAGNEVACPRCGMTMPPSVLRCRDCGAYLNPEVEAAAMARMASRMYQGMRSGPMTGVPGQFGSSFGSPAASSFSTVADDDDFDLNPSVSFGESAPVVPTALSLSEAPSTAAAETDFEPLEQSSGESYDVSSIPLAESPPPEVIPEIPAESATPASDDTPPVPNAARGTADESGVDHSVQTAGAALLSTALEEEQESQSRQKGGRRKLRSQTMALAPGRFLVFCPNGHRIQVQDKHRGRTGRCPNCKGIFFVPLAETSQTTGEGGAVAAPAEGASAESAAPGTTAGYSRWITDISLHRVNPANLKLKPGSLQGESLPVDLGIAADHLLVAVLFSGGGPFRAMQEPKKKLATRKEMLEHFAANKALVELKLPAHHSLSREQLQQLKIVQPSIPGEESLFADVPVFGEGRIGVRVPALDAANTRAYLSFTLSQFRQFSEVLAESYGLNDFGAGTSIPLQDDFVASTCHYSENSLQSVPLDKLPYYQADTVRKLIVLGRKCEKCGLVVSEDARKKEKIGGKSDSSVAKAKCPKCKQKMGSITLYGFASTSPQG